MAVRKWYISSVFIFLGTLTLLVGVKGLRASESDDESTLMSDVDQSFRTTRARAVLLGFACYCYETDNGRFPASVAELHWPVDYFESMKKIYGFDLEKAFEDPMADGHPFLIKPIVRELDPDTRGIRFQNEKVDWWIISVSGQGANMADYDVIYAEALGSNRYLLLTDIGQPVSSNEILYISDNGFRSYVNSPDFKLKRTIEEARLADAD